MLDDSRRADETAGGRRGGGDAALNGSAETTTRESGRPRRMKRRGGWATPVARRRDRHSLVVPVWACARGASRGRAAGGRRRAGKDSEQSKPRAAVRLVEFSTSDTPPAAPRAQHGRAER